jgi:hypothetical protein
MNSELPNIKLSNKPLTKKTVDDLNKLSGILLQKQKKDMNGGNGGNGGGKRKKSKTRKLKKH